MHAAVISKLLQKAEALITWDYPLMLGVIDLSFKG